VLIANMIIESAIKSAEKQTLGERRILDAQPSD